MTLFYFNWCHNWPHGSTVFISLIPLFRDYAIVDDDGIECTKGIMYPSRANKIMWQESDCKNLMVFFFKEKIMGFLCIVEFGPGHYHSDTFLGQKNLCFRKKSIDHCLYQEATTLHPPHCSKIRTSCMKKWCMAEKVIFLESTHQ